MASSLCGATGTRTPDPLLAKQVRYQLRHRPGTASRAYIVPANRTGNENYELAKIRSRCGFRPQILFRLTGLDLVIDDVPNRSQSR